MRWVISGVLLFCVSSAALGQSIDDDIADLRAEVQRLREELNNLRRAFEQFRIELASLREDLANDRIRKEFAGIRVAYHDFRDQTTAIRDHLGGLDQDINQLRFELASVREGIDGSKRPSPGADEARYPKGANPDPTKQPSSLMRLLQSVPRDRTPGYGESWNPRKHKGLVERWFLDNLHGRIGQHGGGVGWISSGRADTRVGFETLGIRLGAERFLLTVVVSMNRAYDGLVGRLRNGDRLSVLGTIHEFRFDREKINDGWVQTLTVILKDAHPVDG